MVYPTSRCRDGHLYFVAMPRASLRRLRGPIAIANSVTCLCPMR